MALTQLKTFTIGELARIALGGEELTSERLLMLQKILLVLLHKLDSHNETVKIKGLPAKCLQSLLKDCPNSCQYNFQLENVQILRKKYQLLEELEGKTREINVKIQQHFQQIHNANRTNIFSADKWHIYASPTEDLGALCLKQDRKYWFLAENSVFNTELRRRVVPQVVDKLSRFEDKVEAMQKQLCEIAQMAEKTTKKLKSVEVIIKDTEDLRSTISLGEKAFRQTIAEVDEMLSCKLHRVTVPALKIYLEKRFDAAKRHLRALQLEAKKCPPPQPLPIENKKTCLSCGRHQHLEVDDKFKNLKSIEENVKCSCCNVLKDPSIIEKIERMQNFDLTVLDPCSSKQSDECENDLESLNILETTSRKEANLKTSSSEKIGVERRKNLEHGPYA